MRKRPRGAFLTEEKRWFRMLYCQEHNCLTSLNINFFLSFFSTFIWLFWVFVAVLWLSLVAVSGGCSLTVLGGSSHCGGFSCGAQALEHALSSCGHRLSC